MTGGVLALIPARGGSKGIPRKNVVEIAGKPLIAWSIQQALDAASITRVIVSTDDDEIADVALQWGAEVPFRRPAEFAGDLSPDLDVMRHALAHLAREEDYAPEMVVHLRPTGPVRRVADLDAAVALLAGRPDADAVRSVSVAHQTPYKMWRILADGTMEPLLEVPGLPDCQSRPRQMLPQVHWQNGYVDVFRPRALEHDSMWGERVLAFVVETRLLDLDYPEDLAPVEAELLRLARGDAPAAGPTRHSV
ncbi:MAG: acylneuraminate cytidylyltransferase family protein [Actinomycetes bacterium]